MYFFIQIISAMFGIEPNRNTVMEKAKAARREQRRDENGGTREEEREPSKVPDAWSLGDLLQWLHVGVHKDPSANSRQTF